MGCQYDPFAHRFTRWKPKEADIAGSYALTDQTITRGELSIFRGPACQLDLRSDGSFADGVMETRGGGGFPDIVGDGVT